MLEIPGVLIETLNGVVVGVPGWITAPSLDEALFAVALDHGRYNISHMPTKRAMPYNYATLDDALAVCAQLEALLADERVWQDPYGLTFPGAITDWRRDHPDTYARMLVIVREPTGKLMVPKEPLHDQL